MAEDAPLILVVDDEPGIVHAISAALRARGLRLQTARTGEEALRRAVELRPSAVILDLGLPDLDGLEVCRRLRQWTDVPIIVLTAEGGEERKVQALDEGADDYVTKPFSTPELLARVRVALRHHRSANERASPVLVVGDVAIDVPARRVTVGDRPVELTPKEFALLVALARQPGRVLTHRSLLQQVWGQEYGTESQYLRVYASQLRRKLEEDPRRPRLVTEPGVGYRLVDNTAPDDGGVRPHEPGA